MPRFDIRGTWGTNKVIKIFTTAQTVTNLATAKSGLRVVLDDIFISTKGSIDVTFVESLATPTVNHTTLFPVYITNADGYSQKDIDVRCVNTGSALNFTSSTSVAHTVYVAYHYEGTAT